MLRAGAWFSRGLSRPGSNALLADTVPSSVYGRAYGFERAMDNLGAIVGPLLAIALIAVFSTRTAILISIIPGLLAVLAIIYAIRHTALPQDRERQPIRLHLRPVMHGDLGHLLVALSFFELGNIAATLLILRDTDLLEPGRSFDYATQLAIVLYVLYNLAATLISVPAGRLADSTTPLRVLSIGVGAFALAYLGFAFVRASIPLLAVFFIVAGVGIGAVETAEHSAVATLAPDYLRGSSFGALAAIQSFGNLIASSIFFHPLRRLLCHCLVLLPAVSTLISLLALFLSLPTLSLRLLGTSRVLVPKSAYIRTSAGIKSRFHAYSCLRTPRFAIRRSAVRARLAPFRAPLVGGRSGMVTEWTRVRAQTVTAASRQESRRRVRRTCTSSRLRRRQQRLLLA